MIGFPYTNKPVTGDYGKELAEKYLKKAENTAGWEAFTKMRKQAAEAGIQDMSLDEINAIIKDVRDGR